MLLSTVPLHLSIPWATQEDFANEVTKAAEKKARKEDRRRRLAEAITKATDKHLLEAPALLRNTKGKVDSKLNPNASEFVQCPVRAQVLALMEDAAAVGQTDIDYAMEKMKGVI
ncbi:unnamed protein product [Cladocopium goreaui]|uniref:Uncharacterized protein n=1 Tax=Cladocopium goreaui TaxID=2562237 RepID=A0A9P1D7N8_9DINO|nr:unnamed protein product [Cladocopium goreaui]|mmetsp:Transcript_63027/g.138099  ORF Transcript_63027/g.138099 Transcript_63027/m.138099 type:complete len:114 (+) Transcript_63027:44-385(+)